MTQYPAAPPHGPGAPQKSIVGLILGIVLGAVALVILLVVALAVGILLPSLSKAREAAQQIKASSQLRSIHQAMIMYAQANDDLYPPADTWEQTLLGSGLLVPEVLVSPLDDGDGTTYIPLLRPGQRVMYDPTAAIMFEDPNHFADGGTNVVFDDGHVRLVSADELALILQEHASRVAEPSEP